MEHLNLKVEIKAAGDAGEFEGVASVFGVKDLGGDIVERGAFAKSLKARPATGVKMLADHDPRARIGVWTSIEEDENGLNVKGRLLLEKEIGRDAHIDLKAGVLDSLSIGYVTKDSSFDGRRRARLLKEVDLLEISLVTFPMLPDARVSAVKSADGIKTIREFEDFLRDAGGFSRAAARAIAMGGFKATDPRDEDGADLAALLRRNIETLSS